MYCPWGGQGSPSSGNQYHYEQGNSDCRCHFGHRRCCLRKRYHRLGGGLVIPHIARMLVDNDNRVLIPASFSLGAGFLVLVDDLGGRVLTGSEIPLGILTALVGGPFLSIYSRKPKGGWLVTVALVEANSISFKYQQPDIFRDISFAIGPGGEVFCLLGPNGCGKTTLLDCVLGLQRPYQGEIVLNGTDIRNLAREQVAQQVAYVPQHHEKAFPYTVLDMSSWGRAAYIGLFDSPPPART